MKKLLRYLVNTILFVVIFSIPTIFIMGYAVSQYGTRPNALSAFGPIFGLLIAYILVKRINKSNLWASLFDEKESVNYVVDKKVEVVEEKIDLSEKPKINKEQDSFSHKIGYFLGKNMMYLFKNFLYVILFLGIIYIIIPNRDFYNYHSTKNLFLNNTHSFDELRFIDNHYYTKKDMKKVKSGGFIDYFWGNRYYRIKNGKKHGEWWYFEGIHRLVNYKEGEIDGLCKSYFYYGSDLIKDEVNFKNGKFHGLAKSWHINGQLESEIMFKEGKIENIIGVWDKEAKPLDFEFDMNKTFYANDWNHFEANEISKALLYTQKQYPSKYCPSKYVSEYFNKHNLNTSYWGERNNRYFDGTMAQAINDFFGVENCNRIRTNRSIVNLYDGDINKLIFLNANLPLETVDAPNFHISEFRVEKSYIHILKKQ